MLTKYIIIILYNIIYSNNNIITFMWISIKNVVFWGIIGVDKCVDNMWITIKIVWINRLIFL